MIVHLKLIRAHLGSGMGAERTRATTNMTNSELWVRAVIVKSRYSGADTGE